jgi:glycerophosphoryl diester phosphodiesterase
MKTLSSLKVLVVEDEALVSMLVEDMLTDLGCTIIGPAAEIEEALRLAGSADIDAALLDVNLGGRPIFPVADALKANGLDSRTAPIFVQCFEAGPLKTFGTLSKARRVFLVSLDGGPADRPGTTYAQMLTPAGLKEIAGFADGLKVFAHAFDGVAGRCQQ